MTRNAKYEQRQRDKGLKKVTLWLPVDRDDEIKQAAQMMCDNSDLTLTLLRSISTGRLVSMTSK